MNRNRILNHRFSNEPPQPYELKVGELSLAITANDATLYTKTYEGHIVELGKGALKLSELEDLDLTNAKEGSYIVQQGNKFVAVNTIGSFSSLADVEISNPQEGDYVRYDPLYLSFRNFKPTYALYQLLDVEVADPANETASSAQNNQTLVYDHASGKFRTRTRVNELVNLDDVSIVEAADKYQILMLNESNVWENMDLHIVRDTVPTLGGDLNANGKSILNSSYRVKQVVANTPTLALNYNEADYFIINGVDVGTNTQCILTPVFNLNKNTTAIMQLEIHQSTGAILIGGLENIKYEDGKAISLSGNGKSDLVTITVQKVAPNPAFPDTTVITSFVTAAALNLAVLGEGGLPAYRYDKNRYPQVQVFDKANLYDDYFDYVALLLNFETEQSSGKIWSDDKSNLENTVTTNTTNKPTSVYTFGIQEKVAEFLTESNYINIAAATPIVLDADFTFEFFANYNTKSKYNNSTSVTHTYFLTNADAFSFKYTGQIAQIGDIAPSINQNTVLTLVVGSHTYIYNNAFAYFDNKESDYVHIAVVRKNEDVMLFVNGVYQNPIAYEVDSGVTTITINTASITLKGIMNSVRLTYYSRYTQNFLIPSMRFGLIGGANDILDAQVWDYYWQLDREFEYELFC